MFPLPFQAKTLEVESSTHKSFKFIVDMAEVKECGQALIGWGLVGAGKGGGCGRSCQR